MLIQWRKNNFSNELNFVCGTLGLIPLQYYKNLVHSLLLLVYPSYLFYLPFPPPMAILLKFFSSIPIKSSLSSKVSLTIQIVGLVTNDFTSIVYTVERDHYVIVFSCISTSSFCIKIKKSLSCSLAAHALHIWRKAEQSFLLFDHVYQRWQKK